MLRWRCYVEDVFSMLSRWRFSGDDWGGGGRWGPVNVPWGGGVGTCSRSMWHANDCQCQWCYIDDVTTKLGVGAKHSFRSSSKSVRSDWIVHGCVPVALYLGKPWHITLQNTQLLPSGYYIYIYPHWWENKQRTNLPIQGLLSIYHESAQLYPPQTLVAPHSCKPTCPSYPMKYQKKYNGKMPILLTKSTKSSFWLV